MARTGPARVNQRAADAVGGRAVYDRLRARLRQGGVTESDLQALDSVTVALVEGEPAVAQRMAAEVTSATGRKAAQDRIRAHHESAVR